MPPEATTKSEVTPKKRTGSATRSLAPAIPLAIALLHGAVAGTKPMQPPAAAPTVTVSSAKTIAIRSVAATVGCGTGATDPSLCVAPYPLLKKGEPVDWWFVFKMNAAKFPMCGGGVDNRSCPFTGEKVAYKQGFGQQYVYASSENSSLQDGSKDCVGDTTQDPVGASFDEVYNGKFFYVVWNDQTYQDPKINGCSGNGCDAPWGHSKGLLAWNSDGQGFVMQVTTPSWPASGNAKFPRESDGNTLGCIKNDDDLLASQHFFALRLDKDDLVEVLKALVNASIVTDPSNQELVNNGGPADVRQLVESLGGKSSSTSLEIGTLSTGVQLIGKPSNFYVPPWQMVSSVLGGVSLRTATWWASPEIPSTSAGETPGCWDSSLDAPGAVEIATSGSWENVGFSLKGGGGSNGNHAKLGISTSGTKHYTIFGDMNQQGALSKDAITSKKGCGSSQNGRGGLFFAMDNTALWTGLKGLIQGDTAPTK